MKMTRPLSEAELVEAVKKYLRERGYKKISNVRFAQRGCPDSADPREQVTSISTTADVEPK